MRNDSIDNFRLELNKPALRGSFYVRKGDTRARTIHVTITDNGKVKDLSDTIFVELLIKKPDGNQCDQTMVRVGNELQYTFRTQDINVAGECLCWIMITFKDGGVLTTPTFSVMVSDVEVDQNLEKSTNEYSALAQIIIDVTDTKNSLVQYADEQTTILANYAAQGVEAAQKTKQNADAAETAASEASGYASAAEQAYSNATDRANEAGNYAASAADVKSYVDAAKEDCEAAADTCEEVLASIPEDYSALSKDVVGLKGDLTEISEPTRNINTSEMGRFGSATDGKIYPRDNRYWGMKDFADIESDSNYTISFGGLTYVQSGASMTFTYLDENNSLISRSGMTISNPRTVTPPTNAKKINVYVQATSDITVSDNAFLQIEKGNVKSNYIKPYSAIDNIVREIVTPLKNGTVQVGGANSITDLNNAVVNRIYTFTQQVDNAPSATGTLLSFAYYEGVTAGHTQIFISSEPKMYYRICWGGGGGTWTEWKEVTPIGNAEKPIVSTLGIFEKFAVIGDSFASGEIVVTPNQRVDYYWQSWGQILARKNGNACLNLSEGGLSTRTWLTSNKGLALLNSSEAQGLYILALGINDNSLGSSYIGSVSDIGTDADTFYGNYGKIINAIKSKSAKSKIIISKTAFNYGVFPQINTAIENIAQYFGIPCIDPRKDYFMGSADFNSKMQNGHPTATMYGGMAYAYERMFNDIVIQYYDYFKDYVGV